MAKTKNFNIVIKGVGGQGLITLLGLISEAAIIEGYEIRTSELHGLSQRGGSVEVHARLGKKVYSPLVARGKADLVLGLEMQECLKACYFASGKTVFLVDKFLLPILSQKNFSEQQVVNALQGVSKNVNVIPAVDICQKEFGTNVVAGVYLLSLAAAKKWITLKPESILKAIENIVPEKYLSLNKGVFELAQKYD